MDDKKKISESDVKWDEQPKADNVVWDDEKKNPIQQPSATSTTPLNQPLSTGQTATVQAPPISIPNGSTSSSPAVNGISGLDNLPSGSDLPKKYDLSQLYSPPSKNVNPDLQQVNNEQDIKNNIDSNKDWTDHITGTANQSAKKVEEGIKSISSKWNELSAASQQNKQTIANLQAQLKDPNTHPDAIPFITESLNKAIEDDKNTDATFDNVKTIATNLQKSKASLLKINQTGQDLENEYGSMAELRGAAKSTGTFLSSAWNTFIPNTISGIGDIIQSAASLSNETYTPEKVEGIRPIITDAFDKIGQTISEIGKSMTIEQQGFEPDKHSISEFAGGLAGSIASIALPAGAGGLAVKGVKILTAGTFAAQGANNAWDELKGSDVSDKDKAIYTIGMGAVNGVIASLTLPKVVDNMFAKGLYGDISKEVVEKIKDGHITGDKIFDVINDTFKDKAKLVATHIAKNAAEGAKFGIAQGVADVGGKQIFNDTQDKPVFTDEKGEPVKLNSVSGLKNVVESAGVMMLATGLMGLGKGALEAHNLSTSTYRKVISIHKDPEALHHFTEQIDAQVKSGDMTPEEHTNIVNNVKSILEADAKIPQTVTDIKSRIRAINLITDRNTIEAKNMKIAEDMTKLDIAMVAPQEELIKQNNEKIVQINNELKLISEGKNDSKNNSGVQGNEREGKKPVASEPDKSAGTQEAGDSGVVQSTPEEDVTNHSEMDEAEKLVSDAAKEKGVELTPEELGDAVAIHLHNIEHKTTPVPLSDVIDHIVENRDNKERETEINKPIEDNEGVNEGVKPKEPLKNKVVKSIANKLGKLIGNITGGVHKVFMHTNDEFNKLLASTTGNSLYSKNKLFNESNSDIRSVAEKYKKDNNISVPFGNKIFSIDESLSKKIADEYDKMKHDPDNEDVKKAYNALVDETKKQYKYLADAGYTFELFDGEGEPYKNSEEALNDLRKNKHLYILSTEKEFGKGITDEQRSDNPLLKSSGEKDVNGKILLNNDVFRGVHDAFGRGERGNGFGAKGEENAWDVHARMFSDDARKALTTETRGQNSWVNFGKDLRDEKGNVRKLSLEEKKKRFAEQKIGLLPEWVSDINKNNNEDLIAKTRKKNKMTEDGKGNYVFYHRSGKNLTKSGIDPNKFGSNVNLTGRDERPMSPASFYYTEPGFSEPGTGNYNHVVKVPVNKVYPFNEDPLNFLEEAEKRFRKEYPNLAFDKNKQVAWVSKVATEHGYDITVADWDSIGGKKRLRAQSPVMLKGELESEPIKGSLNQVKVNEDLQYKSNRGKRVTLYHSNDGDVMGFVDKDGNIHFNESKLSPETPFHEVAGHVLMDWYEKERPDIHAAGIEKIKGSKYLEDVKNNETYKNEAEKLPESERERYYEKEALATAIGDEGAKFSDISDKKSFIDWAKDFWTTIKKHFGIEKLAPEELKSLTLQEFAQKVSARLFEEPTTSKTEKVEEEEPETKVHAIWNRIVSNMNDETLKDEIKKKGIKYIVDKEAVTLRTARNIMKAAIDNDRLGDVEDLVNNERNKMKPTVRGVLSVLLGAHYGKLSMEESNPELRQEYYDKSSEYRQMSAELATKGGQESNIIGKAAKEEYARNPNYVVMDVERRIMNQNEATLGDVSDLHKAIQKILNTPEGKEAIENRVKEGVSAIAEELYNKQPKERRAKIDKTLAALDKIQQKIRSKTYSDITGISAAVDIGITTIKAAIKSGVAIADAIEIGIDKINTYLKNNGFKGKWEKEDEFRDDMINGFKDAKIEIEKGDSEKVKEKIEAKKASIQKLKDEIATGKFSESVKKKVEIENEELKALKEEENKLKKERNRLKNELSPEKKKSILDTIEKKAGKMDYKAKKEFLAGIIHEVEKEGGLSEERFKKMYAKAAGLPTMTDELAATLKGYAASINEGLKSQAKWEKSLNDITDAKNNKADKSEIDRLNKIESDNRKEMNKAKLKAMLANKALSEHFMANKTMAEAFISSMQLNVLTPKSAIRNVTAMASEMGFRWMSYPFTSAADIVMSGMSKLLVGADNFYRENTPFKLLTDNEREKIINNWSGRTTDSFARIKGGITATPEAFKNFYLTYRYGDLSTDFQKREWRNSIDPVKSINNILSGKTKGDTSALAANLLHSVTGWTGEVFSRTLSAFDSIFRTIGEGSSKRELASLMGLKDEELKKFMNNPDSVDETGKSKEHIQHEGNVITYQQNSLAAAALKYAKIGVGHAEGEIADRLNTRIMQLAKQINDGEDEKSVFSSLKNAKKSMMINTLKGMITVLAKSQMLFIKTPTNVWASTFRMLSPEYNAVRFMTMLKIGNKREASKSMGWLVSSFAVRYALISWYKKGLFTTPVNYDNKKELGMQNDPKIKGNGKINISALERMYSGGDWKEKPTDQWEDYTNWSGSGGIVIGSYAQMLHDMDKKDIGKIYKSNYTFHGIGTMTQEVLNLSFMSQAAEMMDAARKGGYYFDKWLVSTARTLESGIYPNTAGEISKAAVKDKQGNVNKKNTMINGDAWESIKNDLKYRAYMGSDLPNRINVWGDKVKDSPTGENTYKHNLIDVFDARNPDEHSFGYKIMELNRRTNNQESLPVPPKQEVTINKKPAPLSPKQYEHYTIAVGKERAALANSYVNNGATYNEGGKEHSWKSDSDEEKIKHLGQIYREGEQLGKAQFILSDSHLTKIKNVKKR